MARPIQDEFLDSRDLMALRYEQGLVFLEVEEIEDTTYEEFSNLEDIESGTSLNGGYQRLTDTNNDDLLHVPSDDEDVVIHVGIGVAPSVIEMFVSYPEDSRAFGALPNLSARPTPGANFGMVDGDDSPYRQPTVESELVIPPKQRLSFDFQNPGDDIHEPLLKVEFRKYRVNPLDPGDRMNRNAIKRTVTPGSPVPIKPVGNFEVKADFNLGNEWDVTPVSMEQARRAVDRGGGR